MSSNERYSAQLRANGYDAGPYRNGTCVVCGATDKHTPNGFTCRKCRRASALAEHEIEGRAETSVEARKRLDREAIERTLENL